MSSEAPLVYISILNWNRFQVTLACLESLKKLDYPNFRVVVVDNGSTDGSVHRIRQLFPELELVENNANYGFARGQNTGIRWALARGARYVWVLNNDTEVDPHALTALVEEACRDERIGAVGSLILDLQLRDRVQHWGGGRASLWYGLSRASVSHSRPPDWITGCSLLLRREALEDQGLLDEGFFMYWEDADLGFRLRRAGWKLAVATGSRLWHSGSGTLGALSSRGFELNTTSSFRFFFRWAPLPICPLLVLLVMRVGKRLLCGDWSAIRATLCGVREGLRAIGPIRGHQIAASQPEGSGS
ncbi:MAG: glycosyltransferase family 2 protein [Candidatus Wallbacteria bacterium]|nr:glycosyltransferase family 2 protein [Candidatus Wallbacteria bacterium]